MREARGIPTRELVVLFAYNLVSWSVGNGLLPLLPKYAGQFGASDDIIGLYLVASYASIAAGTAAAGCRAA